MEKIFVTKYKIQHIFLIMKIIMNSCKKVMKNDLHYFLHKTDQNRQKHWRLSKVSSNHKFSIYREILLFQWYKETVPCYFPKLVDNIQIYSFITLWIIK